MAEKFNGKIIEFRDSFTKDEKQLFSKSLPQRSDFIDSAEHSRIIADLKMGNPILFKPNDIYEGHFRSDNRLEYKPVIFGVLRDGSKAAIILTNNDVSFELQVPDDADPNSFTETIRHLLTDGGVYFKEITLVKHFPGKHFHQEESDYLKISFYTTFQRKKGLKLIRYNDEPGHQNIAISYKRKSKFGSGMGTLNSNSGSKAITSGDDESCYYRKIARENKFQLCGWNWIRAYKIIRTDEYVKRAYVPYCFEVEICNVIDINDSDDNEIKRPKDCPMIDPSKNKEFKDLLFDKSMVCGWDLETYSPESIGGVPEPIKVFDINGKEADIITMDSMCFSWHWSKQKLISICVTIIPTPPLHNALIIKCSTQRELLMIKALILERMCPEFLGEFNGGTYDWPFILRRAEKFQCMINGIKYPLTEFMKLHMSAIPYDPSDENAKYRVVGEYKEQLKLEAGTYYEPIVFKYPGTICIDIRGIFMQIYTKAEKTSLNYFLSLNKLKSKEDMPYQTMFKIVKLFRDVFIPATNSEDFDIIMQYCIALSTERGLNYKPIGTHADAIYCPVIGETTYGIERHTIGEIIQLLGGPAHGGKITEGAGQVVNYCNEDAAKVQELLLARSIIPDKRATADLSFTSMFDALYRANGMKVRNLVMAVASEPGWNLAFSNIGTGKKDERKYPGAYVVAPKKGLYRDHKIAKRLRRRANAHQSIGFGTPGSHSDLIASSDDSGGSKTEVNKKRDTEFAAKIDPKSPSFDKSLLDDVKAAAIKAAEDRIAASSAFSGTNEIYTKLSLDESDDTDRPCTGLDFSSLYPSLMMAYNLSPEKVIIDRDEYIRLMRLGFEMLPVNFKYGLKGRPESEKEDITAWIVQHKHPARILLVEEVARAKRAATDAGLTNNNNHNSTSSFAIGETVGWYKFVDKKVLDKVRKMFRETTLKDWKSYGMGIYPYVLKGLFDKRSKVKKLMEHYSVPREMLDAILKKRPLSEIAKLPLDEQKTWLLNALKVEHAGRIERYEREKKPFFKWKIAEAEENINFFQNTWISEDGDFAAVGLDELYAEMLFKIGYYNTVQLALKVYMNTFYGEAGNQLSAFFIVAVAGGITMEGQLNLRMVKTFVENSGYKVLYGDTDSLYICCPEAKFELLDAEYTSGSITKQVYWTRMIELTMETMDEFKQDVNNYLMLNNMTPFLTMAYEEALWPYCKFGKKKYIGVQHQNVADLGVCMPECTLETFMNSRSLMIRGLEIVKRGASDFLKRVCFDVFRQAFCISEVRTLKQIVEDSLGEITKLKWNPLQFMKSAKYKQPGINLETGVRKPGNVSVLRFMDRMGQIERTHPEFGIKVPDMGERFKYVIVKRYPWKYDIKGNQTDISMADKYEFIESLDNTAYANFVGGLEVDMDYYVTNEVIGQFARFVIYHPDYDQYYNGSDPSLPMTDEEYEQADKMAWAYAKKTLTHYFDANFGTKWTKKGKTHKAIFKGVNKKVLENLNDTYGAAGQLFTLSNTINTKDADSDHLDDLGTQTDVVNRLVSEAKKLAIKWADPMEIGPILKNGTGGSNLVKWFRELKLDPFGLQMLLIMSPGSYYRTRKEYLDKLESKLTHALKLLVPRFQTVYKDSLDTIVELVNKVIDMNDIESVSNTPLSAGIAGSDKKELEMEISFESLEEFADSSDMSELLEMQAQEVVFELHDKWIGLISVYKQLEELNLLRDNLKDMRTMSIDKGAVPTSLRKKNTKDDFMNWLSKQPMSIDTSL